MWKPYSFRILNEFLNKIATIYPICAKFDLSVLNVMLFSASFVKIGAEKDVFSYGC